MTPLSQEFVNSCPVEKNFRIRGLEMTRVEVLVDAAFAFAVTLSAALLMVVLIYIFPLRIMAQGLFAWLSDGYLHVEFDMQSMEELASMFIFLAIGFIALCIVFALMYRYAGSLKEELRLSEYEIHETKTQEYMWTGAAFSGVLCAILAMSLPGKFVPYSGFAFSLLGAWFPYLRSRRLKTLPVAETEGAVE